MFSISHWGMFDARVIPYRLFPFDWDNLLDMEFDTNRDIWKEVSAILG